MVNHTKEKSLIVIKNKNIITRIADFFRNIFNRNKPIIQEIEHANNSEQIKQRHSFMGIDDIEIKFQDFRRGSIKEEELTKEEKEKIIKIFQERIRKEKEETEYYKRKIIEIRKQYFKTV